MPLIFLSLLFFTPAAYATGSPSVVYMLGSELLILVAGVVWVSTTTKPRVVKIQAVALLIFCLVIVILLHLIPNYLAYQVWIEAAAIASVVLNIALAVAVLKRDSK